jgi:probable HAF family extracellular repeat protein
MRGTRFPHKEDTMKKLWLLMSIAIFFFIHSPSALEAAPRYSSQNICGPFGGGWVHNINDAGQVALHLGGDGNWASYLYTPGIGHEYVIFGGISSVNNAGQVVGQAGGYGAYLWSHDQGAKALPGIDGGPSADASMINNFCQILGFAFNSANVLKPVRWDGPNSITDLTTLPGWFSSNVEDGVLTAINDAGLMAGTAWVTDKGRQGALFTGNGWIFLGGLTPGSGESTPMAINNKGEVVGTSPAVPGGGKNHAFYWFDGKIRDLGGLPDYPEGVAQGINEAGQIVGVCYKNDLFGSKADGRAVIWTSEGVADLNTLVINLPPGEKLMSAQAINNSGQIVGYGYWSNYLFLLTPVRPSLSPVLNLLLSDSGNLQLPSLIVSILLHGAQAEFELKPSHDY